MYTIIAATITATVTTTVVLVPDLVGAGRETDWAACICQFEFD